MSRRDWIVDRGLPGLWLLFVGGTLVWVVVATLEQPYQRGKVKRTISSMRAAFTAIESYSVDNGTRYPLIPPAGGVTSLEALRPYLETTYIKRLPSMDAWKANFVYVVDPSAWDYSIGSSGKDRTFNQGDAPPPLQQFDNDIWYSPGTFTQYPEGSKTSVEGRTLRRVAPGVANSRKREGSR